MKILKPTCRPYPDELPLVCEIVLLQTNLIVHELTFETLPPPGEFRRPIFPKTLYPQLFRSACLHLYRGCVCPGGPIEVRYLPHFRGGGDIF